MNEFHSVLFSIKVFKWVVTPICTLNWTWLKTIRRKGDCEEKLHQLDISWERDCIIVHAAYVIVAIDDLNSFGKGCVSVKKILCRQWKCSIWILLLMALDAWLPLLSILWWRVGGNVVRCCMHAYIGGIDNWSGSRRSSRGIRRFQNL